MKAQIWVETVIYTLIGLAIIGMVLAIINPKIKEIKDKNIIEQTIDMLNSIDQKILDIKQASGNVRIEFIGIKRGSLEINGQEDKIVFIIDDSNYLYSQPGKEIQVGSIKVVTEKIAKKNKVTLTLDYKNSLDITYNKQDIKKTFQPAPSPYKVSIENSGLKGTLIQIDIIELS